MKYKAFTLIEVLVVVAIIGLLLSVIIPALLKAKDSGRDILCKNNIRQLGFAISVYTQENQLYPFGFNGLTSSEPPGNYLKYASNDQQGWWWFHYLDNVDSIDTSENGTLWCPMRQIKTGNDAENVLCSNYGINYAIAKIATDDTPNEFEGLPVSPNKVRGSATKVLLIDSGYALISWKAMAEDTTGFPFENPAREPSFYLPGLKINELRSISPDQQQDAVRGRHSGHTLNLLFTDLHIDRQKAANLSADFDAYGNVSNNTVWKP